MDKTDAEDYIQRYTKRLNEFGYSPQALGWGKNGRQDLRFSVLAGMALNNPGSSVLDVGCGFGDLYGFLQHSGWKGKYTGIDMVPSLIETGKGIYPDADLVLGDFPPKDSSLKYDYVISSGIFNARLKEGNNVEHITKTFSAMFGCANIAVCADFMSTYVDFQQEGSWHTDPVWAFNLARTMSRRVLLRYDYMPYEFAIIIFKDDSITPINTFSPFKQASSK